MKVIFVQDVARIGRRGEVKDVADGYARNFLIARGFAREATAGAVRKIEEEKKNAVSKNEKEKMLFLDECNALKEKRVVIAAKANEAGVLFAGITEVILRQKIAELGFENIAAHITLSEPIKEVGTHKVDAVCGEASKKIEIRVNAS